VKFRGLYPVAIELKTCQRFIQVTFLVKNEHFPGALNSAFRQLLERLLSEHRVLQTKSRIGGMVGLFIKKASVFTLAFLINYRKD
jgi:hypothetical protein